MSSRYRRIVIVLALGGLFFCGASGLAQNYVNISHSPGWQSACPRLTVDPAGNIHAVWAEIYAISGIIFLSGDAFYSQYDVVTQQWSTPLNLSSSGLVANSEGYLVGIASDASGNVYVVYVSDNRILLRILSGGTWGAAFEVASNASTIDQTRIAVTPRGDIFTCWWEIAAGAVFSRARIGGVWEAARQISTPGIRSKFADIAVGAGVAYCSWMAGTDVTYHVVVTGRALTAGAAWLSPARATNSPDQEQQPAIAIDSTDVVHIVYTPEFNLERIVRYVFGTAGGFSAPIDLTGREGLHYPSLHARGNNLYACWQAAGGVGYSARTGGSWAKPAVLPNTADVLYLTDVATSPDQGKTYYLWENGNGLGTEIFWSGPQAPSGNIPPSAAFSFSPTTAVFPADITFDASASSDPDGSITKYAWSFSDGGLSTGKIVSHNFKTFGTFAVMLTVTDNEGATGSATRTIQILRLFQPLNIQVTSHVDESLFKVRYLNIVTWEKNPANDSIGAAIATYRVYRKRKTEADSSYAAIGDVAGGVFTFTDKPIKTAAEKDLYAYTVTSLNSEGKESPIFGSPAGSPPAPIKSALVRRGKLKGLAAN